MALVVFAVIAFAPFSALSGQSVAEPAAQTQPPGAELVQKFSLAEAHHDLAELYIKKGNLDQAMIEARKIIQLRFPPEYEALVIQSFSIITEKLAGVRRFDLGHQLLDEAFRTFALDVTRAKTLMNKARLYTLAGDSDRALETWKRALELEGRGAR
jgi:tetratricopeptide (TPR) repeat protein